MELTAATSGIFNLSVDEEARAQMLETTRWTKFIAITSYIMLALLVLLGIVMGIGLGNVIGNADEGGVSLPGSGFGIVITVMYIVIAAISFFPVYFLHRFSRLLKTALLHGNQEQFNEALSFQRKFFKFIGILMIITLAVYGIAIVFGVIGAAVAGF